MLQYHYFSIHLTKQTNVETIMIGIWLNEEVGQVILLVTILAILFLVPSVRIISIKKLRALLVSDRRHENKSGLLLRQMTPIGRL